MSTATPSPHPKQSKTGFYFKDYVNAEGELVISRTRSYRYVCLVCNKVFQSKVSCIAHLDSEHNVQVQEKSRSLATATQCISCDKQFSHRKNMIRHVRMHHPAKIGNIGPTRFEILRGDVGVKKESCPICDKTYTKISGVNRHIRRRHLNLIGDNESDMVHCKFCDMIFPDEKSCVTHMSNYHRAVVTENDQLSFRCTLCEEQFTDQSLLRDHVTSAHGERDLCVEITSDNEEKKLKSESLNCEKCHSSFTSEESWRGHMKEVHKTFPESSCQKCGDSFKTVEELKCHLKDVHLVDEGENKSEAKVKVSKMLQAEGVRIGLSVHDLRVLEKIPEWLVKHGEGMILLAVYK